jgi:hypothetical protein
LWASSSQTSSKASSGRAPVPLRATGRRRAARKRIVRLFVRNAEYKDKTIQAARASARATARALQAPRPWTYPYGKKCRSSECGTCQSSPEIKPQTCALALSRPRAWSRSSACGTRRTGCRSSHFFGDGCVARGWPCGAVGRERPMAIEAKLLGRLTRLGIVPGSVRIVAREHVMPRRYIRLCTKSLPCIRFLCAVPSAKWVNVVCPSGCSSSGQKSRRCGPTRYPTGQS